MGRTKIHQLVMDELEELTRGAGFRGAVTDREVQRRAQRRFREPGPGERRAEAKALEIAPLYACDGQAKGNNSALWQEMVLGETPATGAW